MILLCYQSCFLRHLSGLLRTKKIFAVNWTDLNFQSPFRRLSRTLLSDRRHSFGKHDLSLPWPKPSFSGFIIVTALSTSCLSWCSRLVIDINEQTIALHLESVLSLDRLPQRPLLLYIPSVWKIDRDPSPPFNTTTMRPASTGPLETKQQCSRREITNTSFELIDVMKQQRVGEVSAMMRQTKHDLLTMASATPCEKAQEVQSSPQHWLREPMNFRE